MAIAITLTILALIATYGAARPDALWFQQYGGQVARARSTSPGDPERARRRRTYLVVAVLCWVLAALTFWAVWRGAQPPAPS